MPDQPLDRRRHLVLANTSTAQAFTATSSGGGSSAVPVLDRAQHGNALKAQLLALQPIAQQAVAAQKEQGLESGLGLQVQFVGQPDVALAFESLGYEVGKDAQKKIEVLSVRVEGDTTFANVFVQTASWLTSKSMSRTILPSARTSKDMRSIIMRC